MPAPPLESEPAMVKAMAVKESSRRMARLFDPAHRLPQPAACYERIVRCNLAQI
jgi:hypothetical protein